MGTKRYILSLNENRNVDIVHLFKTLKDAAGISDNSVRTAVVYALSSVIKDTGLGASGGFAPDELSSIRNGQFSYSVRGLHLNLEITVESREPTIVKVSRTTKNYRVRLSAIMSDGSETHLFSHFADEISFSDSELRGKTREEALSLFVRKDVAYVQAG